jgi:D-xylose transport system substrate-binding protein
MRQEVNGIMRRRLTAVLALGAAVATAAALAACGSAAQSGGSTSTGTVSVQQGFKIGLLLPESKTARYEKFDRPYIVADIAKTCPKCQVLYDNASQDPYLQQQQVDSMLTSGVKVLILDPVDAKAIASSVAKAHAQGVKVVAYDRLAGGPIDAYTSFDNYAVGKLQGEALLAALKLGGDPKRGKIVMIDGSPTDPNAAQFKAGAHSVLDGKVVIGKEYDTPDWSPDQANTEAAGAITALGASNIIGFYSANDGMAAGIAKAMANGGVASGTPLTGQDAQLDAIQRILLGQQTMTVYKAIGPEAAAAAQMAVELATGAKVTSTTTVNNSTVTSVPSQVLTPVVVHKGNIESTVVKDGFWKPSEICTGDAAGACTAAGVR